MLVIPINQVVLHFLRHKLILCLDQILSPCEIPCCVVAFSNILVYDHKKNWKERRAFQNKRKRNKEKSIHAISCKTSDKTFVIVAVGHNSSYYTCRSWYHLIGPMFAQLDEWLKAPRRTRDILCCVTTGKELPKKLVQTKK